jgi:hypothetical protein
MSVKVQVTDGVCEVSLSDLDGEMDAAEEALDCSYDYLDSNGITTQSGTLHLEYDAELVDNDRWIGSWTVTKWERD